MITYSLKPSVKSSVSTGHWSYFLSTLTLHFKLFWKKIWIILFLNPAVKLKKKKKKASDKIRIIHFLHKLSICRGLCACGDCSRACWDVLVHRCSSPTAASISQSNWVQTVQDCMLTENKPPTSGPTRYKPMLFKGQWWLITNSLTNGKTDNINVFFFQILQVTEHNTLKDDLEINFCSKVELWVLRKKHFSD